MLFANLVANLKLSHTQYFEVISSVCVVTGSESPVWLRVQDETALHSKVVVNRICDTSVNVSVRLGVDIRKVLNVRYKNCDLENYASALSPGSDMDKIQMLEACGKELNDTRKHIVQCLAFAAHALNLPVTEIVKAIRPTLKVILSKIPVVEGSQSNTIDKVAGVFERCKDEAAKKARMHSFEAKRK